jgi:hypothetical protein
MEQVTLNNLSKDIEFLKKAVISIQEHLEDCFLTFEEETNLEKGLKELEEGKSFSLEDIEKLRNEN